MAVPPNREWASFAEREPSLLKPDHKPRDPAAVVFPFSDHVLTKPVLEATLARKSTMLKRRQTAYYVLTGSGFLLEYKDHDAILHPDPTLALKLAECGLGNSPARSEKAGFTLRGKDVGKSLGRTHEYIFRTDSMEQATQWWNKLEKYVATAGSGDPDATDEEAESPVSPVSAGGQSSKMSMEAAPGQAASVPKQTSDPAIEEPVTASPSATAAPVAHATAVPTTTTGAGYTGPTATAEPTGGAEHVHTEGPTTSDAPTKTAPPQKSAAESAAYHASLHSFES